MSDHAPAQITFYDVPEDQAAAVVKWLNDWGLGEDWEPADDHDSVTLGQSYGDPEANVSIALTGPAQLIAAAPRATWRMDCDAAPEACAEAITHIAGWPLRVVQGDNDGGELFTADQVREAVKNGTVADLLGDTYHAEIARLTELHNGRVLTAPDEDADA
jgi:hypothetical protein